MDFQELDIPGAWVFTPTLHTDDRGVFLESFTSSSLEQATGRSLELAQANISQSKKGAVRGIHYALLPPGQAKYIQCVSGSVYDVVVDIRVGSPTFGQWTAVTLDAVERKSVFISEGLGHGFAALEDNTTLAYFCSTPYTPSREFGISPLDPDLAISWPVPKIVISDKDKSALSLRAAQERELLPTYESCLSWTSQTHNRRSG